jgi:hypothetical protein
MVIPFVLSDTYLDFIVTCFACSIEEVFRKKLAGLVEFVIGSLYVFSCVYPSNLQTSS